MAARNSIDDELFDDLIDRLISDRALRLGEELGLERVECSICVSEFSDFAPFDFLSGDFEDVSTAKWSNLLTRTFDCVINCAFLFYLL